MPSLYAVDVYDSLYQHLTGVEAELAAAGIAAAPVVLQETYYSDAEVFHDLQRASEDLEINLESVMQWPTHRGVFRPDGSRAGLTLDFPQDYSLYRFGMAASLEADPNPCTIAASANVCTANLVWSTDNAPGACVFIQNSGALVACARSGSLAVPWITRTGHLFEVRASKDAAAPILTSLFVSGM